LHARDGKPCFQYRNIFSATHNVSYFSPCQKSLPVPGGRPVAYPHAGNEFFSAWENGKGLSPGTGSGMGEKETVSLQEPKGFPALGNGKGLTPGIRRLFRHGEMKRVSLHRQEGFFGMGEVK
jgi:hypothetical protein